MLSFSNKIMNLKTIFKRTILLDFSLLILIIITLFYPSTEVAQFNQYYENELSGSFLILVLILQLAYVINLFLLYKFKSIGKKIYIILFVLMWTLSLLLPPSAADAFQNVIMGLGYTISGAILVFLYFTPIKKEFDK